MKTSMLAAVLFASALLLAFPTAGRSQSNATANTPMRVAIVGLVHPHAGAVWDLLRRAEVKVVGICEPNAEVTAQYVIKGLDKSLLFSDEADMIEKTHPHAILIYTTTYDHRRVVEIAARYGVHAMMEKPLAVSNEDAQAIANAARAGKIQVLVNFATTWYPNSTAAYNVLHDKSIGEARKIVVLDGHSSPRQLTGPLGWLADPKLNGGGALFDFGCYGANLVTWLMDGQRPTSVTAVMQTFKPNIYPNVDDEATIILTYPKAQAILQASWNWPFDRKDMEVYAENGYAITVGTDSLRVRRLGKREEQIVAQPPASPQDETLSYLRAVVLDGIKPVGPSSLETNIIATEILDAARESARTGRRIDLGPPVSRN
jgi:predicted dehydrogenase